MSEEQFTGDDWICRCGNQPHTNGFFPCLRDGTLVEPTPAEWTDGLLYRCMGCDAIVAHDPASDTGRVVGTATARDL